MTTLELVQSILAFSKEFSAGAAIARLEVVENVLEGTSTYMHPDIVKAAFRTKEEGE